jgi:DNA polymerase-3 subunit alpha
MEGGIRNGYTKRVLEKIWKEFEDKGACAFNKSHAVCYTWIAYQMAYLKANYPVEFQEVMKDDRYWD